MPAQTTYAYGYPQSVTQLDTAALQSIHKTCDDSIEWESVAASPVPPNSGYNPQMWEYYHSMAEPVLAGDIDAYLQMIAEVNPLGDLLSYGGNFEFGTDDPRKIEVEFTVNESALFSAKSQLRMAEYNVLLQDYVCSVCIRIARDMFALLPVGHTIVHCVLKNKTIVSVDFDRESLEKVKFGLIDSSETLSMFRNNMSFDEKTGFAEVPVLE